MAAGPFEPSDRQRACRLRPGFRCSGLVSLRCQTLLRESIELRAAYLAFGIAAILVLMTVACSGSRYARDADREVAEILDVRTLEVLGARKDHVIRPRKLSEGENAKVAEFASNKPMIRVDLNKALQTAVQFNRGYLSRKESLFLSGLGFSLTRFNFGPLVSSTISYIYNDSEAAVGAHNSSANFNVSQILPTGGTLSFTSSVSGTWPEGGISSGQNSFGSSAGVALSQPLLRGFGYEVSHESLTQAQRSLVYDIRDFELFREDFSIMVARNYFDLVGQKETLANEEKRYDEAELDRKKAVAIRSVDRATDQDVFLAQRRAIDSENSVINARADYDRAVDEFKITLGLPLEQKIIIVDAQPPFESVRLDVESAVKAAQHNRLDIHTTRDQLQDAIRALRISEDGLRPDLNLDVSAGLGGSDTTFGRSLKDDYSYSAGISLTIPLQQKAARNSYRSTLLSLEQSKRNLTLTLDRLSLSIRDQIRQLQSQESRIELQGQQITQEMRAVAVSQIRYEAGELDNRDLLDARQALIDAENQLIRLKVQHFIGRLQLLRDLGLLFIDKQGKWVE